MHSWLKMLLGKSLVLGAWRGICLVERMVISWVVLNRGWWRYNRVAPLVSKGSPILIYIGGMLRWRVIHVVHCKGWSSLVISWPSSWVIHWTLLSSRVIGQWVMGVIG